MPTFTLMNPETLTTEETMRHYIYIDIETIPRPMDRSALEAVTAKKVPKNLKDPKKIDAWIEANAENVLRQRSLSELTAEVLCVSMAVGDEDPVTFGRSTLADENAVLSGLRTELHLCGAGTSTFVGHNVRFDLAVLWSAALRNGMPELARMVRPPDKPWSESIYCTMSRWPSTSSGFAGNRSLASIAEAFSLGEKTPGIDGSKVYDYYLEGRHEEIEAYCAQDVVLCREVHQMMMAGGL